MSILVLDAGSSGIRAAVVDNRGHVVWERLVETIPDTSTPGLVEFDPAEYGTHALTIGAEAIAAVGPVDAVGISTQRASCIVWDRDTGQALAPAQSWQDLRTLGECLRLRSLGLRLAPNQTATKIAHILDSVEGSRSRNLCAGTPDAWLVWLLTEGAHFVTDATNAAVTGLTNPEVTGWDAHILDVLDIPLEFLPTVVSSSGYIGDATALPGSPPICGLVGDQQSSLIGQGCFEPGHTKITFGTGAMLDLCIGHERPAVETRTAHGSFPIVCWRRGTQTMWGLEAIALSAGTNVQWLRDELGIIASVEESEALAATCETSEGVSYVAAQLGLGTPHWDYGARGALLGLTRGSSRAHVCRAVLEGIAQGGADLIEAATLDAGIVLEQLRVDGGMSRNTVFVQALANLSGHRIEVSPVRDATTLGAAFLAGLECGIWPDWESVGSSWNPLWTAAPDPDFDRASHRSVHAEAVKRSTGWIEQLSQIDF